MEKFVERTLLYDFYGELLTKRQQEIYESVVLEDYSLSEVAEDQQVSRQSIHDMVRRCDKVLLEYESKLHLVERFLKIRSQVREISQIAHEQGITRIEEICSVISGEL